MGHNPGHRILFAALLQTLVILTASVSPESHAFRSALSPWSSIAVLLSQSNPMVANELRSCFKFLVPFIPPKTPEPELQCPSLEWSLNLGKEFTAVKSQRNKENERIWWPPEPVRELARLAFDSGGDRNSIDCALDPTMFTVPDVEGSKEDRCKLTRWLCGRRFICEVSCQRIPCT